MSEPDKAKALNQYLLQRRLVTPDDVIVADGFWLAGIEHLPRTISVCHGIWGHVTQADVDSGKHPENPQLHTAQITFRDKFYRSGGNMVAVSDFIADEMERQWGWKVPVINTGIDLNVWRPIERPFTVNPHRPIIIHGINDKGNTNKGWDHVEKIAERLHGRVFIHSLDDVKSIFKLSSADAFSMASLCVIPSGFEGNSLFCLEALACDVPVIAYDVGLPYLAKKDFVMHRIGRVLDRTKRSPSYTAACIDLYLMARAAEGGDKFENPRQWVSQFSIESFRKQWYDYVEALG